MQVSVLLETAVIFVFLAADVTCVPEIVCEGGRTHRVTEASITQDRSFVASSLAFGIKDGMSPVCPSCGMLWQASPGSESLGPSALQE